LQFRLEADMAEKSSRVPISRATAPLRQSDGDGNHIHNQILLRLPAAERDIVFPKLELVRLRGRQMLHEVGDTLKSAYFCNTGMISILTVFSDGKSIEAGLIGKEGFVGIPLVAGFRSASTRAVVQVEATALRIDAEALYGFLQQCHVLERQLQQCSQMMAMEATQLAACNRLHAVEQRLARWLLLCSDRLGTKSLPLTQELLSQMLGTRRASVTIAAGILQKAGFIAQNRGSVTITDRGQLEQVSCECYGMMLRQRQRWEKDSE
jgi:CRP-like cAMP-binding protein